MSQGNPNHPLVRQAETEWHKFAAILMLKFGLEAVQVTEEDVQRLAALESVNILLDARNGQLWLRLVTDEEANRLARQEGGLAH